VVDADGAFLKLESRTLLHEPLSSIPLQEMIGDIIGSGGAGAIIMHSHVIERGEVCQPSAGDQVAVRRIREALHEHGLILQDFCIVGPVNTTPYSWRESGDFSTSVSGKHKSYATIKGKRWLRESTVH
jgi:hypothetical protein